MTVIKNGEKAENRHSGIWQKLRGKSSASTPPAFPQEWQCIIHLKLMRLFARLRSDLVKNFIKEESLETLLANVPQTERDQAEAKLREQIWQIYLEKAAKRFEAWWISMVHTDQNGHINQINVSMCLQPGQVEGLLRDTTPMTWTQKNLPPLDVLMVLHSYMLNPRRFLEDCLRYNMLPLWKAGIPWKILDDVIDTSTNEYFVPPAGQRAWTKTTGCEWDIRQARLATQITCPFCNNKQTNQSRSVALEAIVNEQVHYCHAKSPVPVCQNCGDMFDDELLKVKKLRQVVENLRQRDIPLPGTILSRNGLAKSAPRPGEEPELFALNRLLQGEVGTQILHHTEPDSLRHVPRPKLEDLYSIIEPASGTDADLSAAAAAAAAIKIGLRRLMAQVSDSTSPFFALDLPAAVTRQRVFVEQMETIDWVHSPALTSTLTTILARYRVFFQIMDTHRSHVAVPTHAVDLAWHTHQLSPASYYAFSVANAGDVFIDHDDRIEETVRNDAFEWTCRAYRTLATAADDYGGCLCWVCAAAHEYKNHSPSSLETDPSGHVRLISGSDLERHVLGAIAAKQYAKLEEDFGLACQDARSRRLPLPDRGSFLESYVWLYPQARPVLNAVKG